MNAKVSVILPTYNRAYCVGRAIESVLVQTYKDWELIVVDDCSTDNTKEVVEAFKDSRIKYIKLDRNSGSSAHPRNMGILESKGEYIALLDSDDEWLGDKLEKEVEILDKNKEIGLVYCATWIEDKYWLPKPPDKDFLPGILPSTALVRKELVDKVGGFVSLPGFSDTEWFYRLLKVCIPYAIEEPLVWRHLSKDSFGANPIGHALGLEGLMNLHPELWEKGYVLVALGNAFTLAGCPRREYFIKGIRKGAWVGLISYILSFCGLGLYKKISGVYKGIYGRH